MTHKQRMIAILVGWLVMFGGYIGWQERSISTGTKVRLQTRPVDPNDFFRGDYVTLSYDISSACDLPMRDRGDKDEFGNPIMYPQDHSRDDMSMRESYMGGKLVYVPLVQSGDVMIASGCLDKKPQAGVFLKGIRHDRRGTLYGIEKYFVQQGTGKPLEEARGTMKVQVSISKGGTARIIGYSFE